MSTYLRLIPVKAALLWFVFLTGCTHVEDNTDKQQAANENDQETAAKTWEAGENVYAVGVDDELMQVELVKASAMASESAGEANRRWQQANPMQKENWLIKWAAPIQLDDENRKEYVWVKPVEWSPFRIEGILVNEPFENIGFSEGDLVAFPVEELYDWVYKIEGTMQGPRQGGFTLDVLEKHFGTPNRSG